MDKKKHDAIGVTSNSDWDKHEDYLIIKEGVCTLKRRYLKMDQYLLHLKTELDSIPVSAEGISAYLSYENRFELSPSLRERIRHREPYQSSDYFTKYFNLCFNYYSRENNCRDEDERKSDQMLIMEHLSNEETYFQESYTLFTEVYELESSAFETIKKTACRYIEWVKNNKVTKDAQVKPIELFHTHLIHRNPEELAKVCRSIFNKNKSPKDYAIMVCLLSEKSFIVIQNKRRTDFYKAWYKFINAPLPKNSNFNAINKNIVDKAINGFVYKDETDQDYCNLKDTFDKALINSILK